MEEKELRKALKIAKENGKSGLLIWANEETQNIFGNHLIEGNEIFEFILKSIQNGKGFEIPVSFKKYELPGLIGFPINKLESEEFFQEVVAKSKEDSYRGPIILISDDSM